MSKLRCPKCGSDAGFLIETYAVQSFDKDGHCLGNYKEPMTNPYSTCTCVDCDHEDILLKFNDTKGEIVYVEPCKSK